MTSPKKPALPTPAEVEAKIEQASRDELAARVKLGEALFDQQTDPERNVAVEQAAVDEARRRVDQLKALLPIVEKAEAEALEATRATLAEGQRRQLEKALKDLLKYSIAVSVHYQKVEVAYRRLISTSTKVKGLLFDGPRRAGQERALSPAELHRLCELELSRIGLAPLSAAYPSPDLHAPGAKPQSAFANAASRMPPLEATIRSLAAAILASAPGPLGARQGDDAEAAAQSPPEPLPRPQESGNGGSLPQVAAGAEASPTGSLAAEEAA